MKKAPLISGILFGVLILLCGCEPALKSECDIINKAREYLSDNIDGLSIGGSCSDNNRTLFWFISGNSEQAHTYIPMEFAVNENSEYSFVHKYDPIERTADTAALMWKNGYSFIVNNPDCANIRITEPDGSVTDIGVTEIPFVYFLENAPDEFEYGFLNANGETIK